jgi:hypothetical protein
MKKRRVWIQFSPENFVSFFFSMNNFVLDLAPDSEASIQRQIP